MSLNHGPNNLPGIGPFVACMATYPQLMESQANKQPTQVLYINQGVNPEYTCVLMVNARRTNCSREPYPPLPYLFLFPYSGRTTETQPP